MPEPTSGLTFTSRPGPSAPETPSDEFTGLTTTFYSSAPASYLNHRLQSLVAVGANGSEPNASREPVEFRSMVANLEADEAELRKYAALESTVLLHHAAETLLRLYLAHANSEQYPWMKLVQLTNARAFKERVKTLRDRLDDPNVVSDLVETCSVQLKDSAPGDLVAAWNKHSDAVSSLFRKAADVVLNDASFYNSAKHGLATLAGDSAFTLSPESGDSFTHSGDALTIIEVRREPSHHTWRLSTLWVDIDLNLETVHILTMLIDSLWNKAKQRRNLDHDAQKICFFDGDAVHAAIRTRRLNGGVIRMSLPIVMTMPN